MINIIMGTTRKQSTCYPVASGNSWSTALECLKCSFVTNLTVLKLLNISSKNCKITTEKTTQLAISYQSGCAMKEMSMWLTYILYA